MVSWLLSKAFVSDAKLIIYLSVLPVHALLQRSIVQSSHVLATGTNEPSIRLLV